MAISYRRAFFSLSGIEPVQTTSFYGLHYAADRILRQYVTKFIISRCCRVSCIYGGNKLFVFFKKKLESWFFSNVKSLKVNFFFAIFVAVCRCDGDLFDIWLIWGLWMCEMLSWLKLWRSCGVIFRFYRCLNFLPEVSVFFLALIS